MSGFEPVLYGVFIFLAGLVLLAGFCTFWLLRSRSQLAARLEKAQRRLEAILNASQKFTGAADEREIIDLALHASVRLTGAKGAAFVPLDEYGQPCSAIPYGEQPKELEEAWLEYMATPAVRERCQQCSKNLTLESTCPLKSGPFPDDQDIYCMSFERGEHEYGLLTLYFSGPASLDAETRDFMQALVDVTSLALESERLRQRELYALRKLQEMRQGNSLATAPAGQPVQGHQAQKLDIARLEYGLMMGERARLAREIHDGLAQTLSFLKLQLLQLQGYLEKEDKDRLRRGLEESHQAISEAYDEARIAIDGLRVSPSDEGLASWLPQIAQEYQEWFGAAVKVSISQLDVKTAFSSEVQAQLIRIVQEALSNIRKHAQASNVDISALEENGILYLRIQDDGQGFNAQDIAGSSRYGLRGIRERAELVGAEIHVASQPGQGTQVEVCLPVKA